MRLPSGQAMNKAFVQFLFSQKKHIKFAFPIKDAHICAAFAIVGKENSR
jgi:hypothetical protein